MSVAKSRDYRGGETPSSEVNGVPLFVRVLGPGMARLLGLGLRLGPASLLTVRGHTTGRARTIPVALFEHQGHRYIAAIFGEVSWVRNLRAAGEGVVTRGRRRRVVAVELTPEVAGRVLKDAVGPHPPSRLLAAFLRRYLKVTPETGLDTFIEQAGRHPVFELHASSQAASQESGNPPTLGGDQL